MKTNRYGKLYNNSELLHLNLQKDNDTDVPKQVAFKDNLEENPDATWNFGIYYREVVICGCCGGVIELADIDKMIVLNDWFGLNEEALDIIWLAVDGMED